VTILDGQQAGRCVVINGYAATVNGFTIRNGLAVDGGGVYCNGGTIQNCVLVNNQAIGSDVNDGSGGGAYVAYGTVSNCVFYSNSASSTNSYQNAWGGGVYCYGSVMQGCIVTNNLCIGYYANGGGVTLTGGTMRNSLIAGNSAVSLEYANGGGVYANIMQSSVSSFIEACIITNNSVTTTDTYVYTAASASGGGLNVGNGTIVRSTLVAGNIAQSLAGFTSGGGVCTSGSIFENCTVVYNTATTQNGNQGAGGGVIWGYSDQCYNNIVKFNNAANGSDNGEINSLSYPMFFNSDIGPVVPAASMSNCITSDPMFINNVAGGNYQLQPGSPCIDTGTNQAWMIGAADLNGRPRIIGGLVDMGAYEFGSVSPVVTASKINNNLVLQWPTNTQGFALWSTTNLSAGNWLSNTVIPTIVNGQYTVTNVIAGPKSFFRLMK
jgi:hypothetical protein